MNPENNHSSVAKGTIIGVVILLILAVVAGWYLGRSGDSDTKDQPTATTTQPTEQVSSEGRDVNSLISYSLPDGWKEATCPSAAGAAYIVPAGSGSVNCNANPSSAVKISVDSSNSKDCNQLQNVQNVSKHVCVSEFINGKKSLKAETIFNKDSSYGEERTVNAYYIDLGSAVVKLEYVHKPDSNEALMGFEQLAKSVKAKV